MRGVAVGDVRAVSAHLFGNRYRLELLAAFAEAPEGRVNVGALAAAQGVEAAVYYPALRDLLALQMVDRVAELTRDRRRWYQRAGGDRIWEPMRELVAGLRGHFDEILGSAVNPDSGHEKVGA
ncbi:hypothetical protein GCM10023194_25680 [Planotetraspora phitsanulokensis]|uniref:Uncharacterized protein n=1 Tax=Planotetraspora phitsanulokensis TaxID=575192 RepID=A0A8J3XI94_9ACTN|nr:hypothetical protein [Planotetraspora phitsanulokensis]GII41915.1 hypothetical protein Pph01_69180 [Planotetraspora phitsanulokensis]